MTKQGRNEIFYTLLFGTELDQLVEFLKEVRGNVTEQEEKYFREGFYFGVKQVGAMTSCVIRNGLLEQEEVDL